MLWFAIHTDFQPFANRTLYVYFDFSSRELKFYHDKGVRLVEGIMAATELGSLRIPKEFGYFEGK